MTRDEAVGLTGDEELLFADGFDDALIAVGIRCGQPTLAVYDIDKCIECLIADGMNDDEAQEYFEFNTLGAWVGDRTPIYVTRGD